MRKSICLLLAALACLTVATTADARRKANRSEKKAIAQRFNAPPKCAKVFVSTVNEHWASYQFNPRKIDVKPCDQVAADGIAILHRKHRSDWRLVTAGSDFTCPVPRVPVRVAEDLRVPCHG
jgi:hypothetical protein